MSIAFMAEMERPKGNALAHMSINVLIVGSAMRREREVKIDSEEEQECPSSSALSVPKEYSSVRSP